MDRDNIKHLAKSLAASARLLHPDKAPALGKFLDLIARCSGVEDWNALSRHLNGIADCPVDRDKVAIGAAELADVPPVWMTATVSNLGQLAQKFPEHGFLLLRGEEVTRNGAEIAQLLALSRSLPYIRIIDVGPGITRETLARSHSLSEQFVVYAQNIDDLPVVARHYLLEQAQGGSLVMARTQRPALNFDHVVDLLLGGIPTIGGRQRKMYQALTKGFCGIVDDAGVVLAAGDGFLKPEFATVKRVRYFTIEEPVEFVLDPQPPANVTQSAASELTVTSGPTGTGVERNLLEELKRMPEFLTVGAADLSAMDEPVMADTVVIGHEMISSFDVPREEPNWSAGESANMLASVAKVPLDGDLYEKLKSAMVELQCTLVEPTAVEVAEALSRHPGLEAISAALMKAAMDELDTRRARPAGSAEMQRGHDGEEAARRLYSQVVRDLQGTGFADAGPAGSEEEADDATNSGHYRFGQMAVNRLRLLAKIPLTQVQQARASVTLTKLQKNDPKPSVQDMVDALAAEPILTTFAKAIARAVPNESEKVQHAGVVSEAHQISASPEQGVQAAAHGAAGFYPTSPFGVEFKPSDWRSATINPMHYLGEEAQEAVMRLTLIAEIQLTQEQQARAGMTLTLLRKRISDPTVRDLVVALASEPLLADFAQALDRCMLP